LPIALVFLLMAFLLMHGKPGSAWLMVTAIVGFLVVSVPFIGWLSVAKGRFTIGDAGRFNYSLTMNEIGRLAHWQKDVLTGAPLKHPTRKLLDQPALFEFATPIGGTYPPWTDPYHWFEGMSIHFSVSRQLTVIAKSLWLYWFILPPLVVGGIAVASLASEPLSNTGGIFSHWPIVIPAAVALCMYALIHVEYRYVAPFIVVLWSGIFAGIRPQGGAAISRALSSILVGTGLVLLVALAFETVESINAAARGQESSPVQLVRGTAASLERAGFKPGTQVATIAGLDQPYWARMLGLRIIAEVPFDQRMSFWFGGDDVQRRVLSIFRQTGATVVVAENVPAVANTSGWRHVDGTDAWWRYLGD